jgi:hypothetical protein
MPRKYRALRMELIRQDTAFTVANPLPDQVRGSWYADLQGTLSHALTCCGWSRGVVAQAVPPAIFAFLSRPPGSQTRSCNFQTICLNPPGGMNVL